MPPAAARPLARRPLIARLPGLFARTRHALGHIRRRLAWPTPSEPTVFHVTHHKAGSQWIHRILQTLAFDRVVLPEVLNNQFLKQPVKCGLIYPTLYVTREQFESVCRPRHSRHFVVIRDLRDTLVSLYFSLKNSHELLTDLMRTRRTMLNELSQEDGLLYLIDCGLTPMAQVQWSWVSACVERIRYEDLLARDEEILTSLLLDHCGLKTDPNHLRDVIRSHRFEALARRKPGNEDTQAHERKGIAGDWRNYFTAKVVAEFKRCYGSLLIATGYEKGFAW